jgi:hypothetical protein
MPPEGRTTKVNAKKSFFAHPKLEYLGYVINPWWYQTHLQEGQSNSEYCGTKDM